MPAGDADSRRRSRRPRTLPSMSRSPRRTWMPPSSAGSTARLSSICRRSSARAARGARRPRPSSSCAALVAVASTMPSRRLYRRRNSRAMSVTISSRRRRSTRPTRLLTWGSICVREQRLERLVALARTGSRGSSSLRTTSSSDIAAASDSSCAEPLLVRGLVAFGDLERGLGVAACSCRVRGTGHDASAGS